eukprot:jgi/Botrbrau1/8529/Bobra.0029s0033.1
MLSSKFLQIKSSWLTSVFSRHFQALVCHTIQSIKWTFFCQKSNISGVCHKSNVTANQPKCKASALRTPLKTIGEAIAAQDLTESAEEEVGQVYSVDTFSVQMLSKRRWHEEEEKVEVASLRVKPALRDCKQRYVTAKELNKNRISFANRPWE